MAPAATFLLSPPCMSLLRPVKISARGPVFWFGDWRASAAVLDPGRAVVSSIPWAERSPQVSPENANVGPRYEAERLLLLVSAVLRL